MWLLLSHTRAAVDQTGVVMLSNAPARGRPRVTLEKRSELGFAPCASRALVLKHLKHVFNVLNVFYSKKCF